MRRLVGRVRAARCVARASKTTQWIRGDEGGNLRWIIGMPFDEQSSGGFDQRATLVGEAHRAFVENEDIGRNDVAPAGLGGAQAEVVLLAVTAAESLVVEQSDRVEARTPDVHAEADRGRQVFAARGIDRCEKPIERGQPEPSRNAGGPTLERIRANGRLVR